MIEAGPGVADASALSLATAADAPAMAALHSSAFARGWSAGEIARLLGDGAVRGHASVLRGRLAGFVLSRGAFDEAEILTIVVDPAQRRTGLGRALLETHLRHLEAAGIQAVFLEVDETNGAARALYARRGFREVGRRRGYYRRRDGGAASALVLRRDL